MPGRIIKTLLKALLLVALFSGLWFAYQVQTLSAKYDQVENATEAFVRELATDWRLGTLERLLGEQAVASEIMHYITLLDLGREFGNLEACNVPAIPVAVTSSGDSFSLSDEIRQHRTICRFSNAYARVSVRLHHNEGNVTVAHLDLKRDETIDKLRALTKNGRPAVTIPVSAPPAPDSHAAPPR